MGRILSIDYGKKRTGLAVSDPLCIIAGGLTTLSTVDLESWLIDYVPSNDVTTIVLGKPTQMNGMPSENFSRVEPFYNRLRKLFPNVEIVYEDERFTSVIAQRAIIDGGVKKQRRREDKGLVDKVSAVIILQSYLDSHKTF